MLFDEIENEFRPLKKYDKIISGYYVSKDGRIYSTLSNKFIRPVKETCKASGRLTSLKFTAEIEEGLFDDYNYSKRYDNTNKWRVTFRVHKAVMDVWKPIDENPPEQLKQSWNEVPEEWRQWVKDTAYIDHIDDDPSNNHVDNLRWVTPKENCVHRKKAEFANPNVIELNEEDSEWLIEKSNELGKDPQETFEYLFDSYLDDVEKRSNELGVSSQDVFKCDFDKFLENDRTKGLAKFYQSK